MNLPDETKQKKKGKQKKNLSANYIDVKIYFSKKKKKKH